MGRPDTQGFGKKYTDQLGLNKNFFYNLRRTNMPCFEYINAKAPGDIVTAYRAYQQERTDKGRVYC